MCTEETSQKPWCPCDSIPSPGQRAAVVERGALPAVRPRPGRARHHRRQRPERRGRDHDDRRVDRHDPAVRLAVPEGRARERGAAGTGGVRRGVGRRDGAGPDRAGGRGGARSRAARADSVPGVK